MSRLRELREAAGLSKRQLARRSGVSHRQVIYLEQRRDRGRNPTVRTLARLALPISGEIGMPPADVLKALAEDWLNDLIEGSSNS